MTFNKKANIRSSVILGCYVMVPLVGVVYAAGDIRTHFVSQPVYSIRSVNTIHTDPYHSLSTTEGGFWSSLGKIFTRDF